MLFPVSKPAFCVAPVAARPLPARGPASGESIYIKLSLRGDADSPAQRNVSLGRVLFMYHEIAGPNAVTPLQPLTFMIIGDAGACNSQSTTKQNVLQFASAQQMPTINSSNIPLHNDQTNRQRL